MNPIGGPAAIPPSAAISSGRVWEEIVIDDGDAKK